jgi:hypothetical protein
VDPPGFKNLKLPSSEFLIKNLRVKQSKRKAGLHYFHECGCNTGHHLWNDPLSSLQFMNSRVRWRGRRCSPLDFSAPHISVTEMF